MADARVGVRLFVSKKMGDKKEKDEEKKRKE